MATFVPRANGTYQAKINISGQKISQTFPNKKDAVAWAAIEETRLRARMKFASGMTLGQIMEKFAEHYKARTLKKGYVCKPANVHLGRFGADFMAVDTADMTKDWWLQTVEAWGVSPGTATRYMTYITSSLKYAEQRLDVHVDWKSYHDAKGILRGESMVGHADERSRRLQPGELERLKNAVRHTHVPLADMMDFAILTALRLGEICNLKWSDLNEVTKMILVRDRKDPKAKINNNTKLPLLKNALAIIKRQPTRKSDRIFPYISNYVSALFNHTVTNSGIEDFHFHDFRHEAISRLFEEGYAIQQVALISGHKNWKHLKRYTNLKAEDIHKGPLAVQAAITRRWDQAA